MDNKKHGGMNMKLYGAFFIIFTLVLTSCGGGGGSEDAQPGSNVAEAEADNNNNTDNIINDTISDDITNNNICAECQSTLPKVTIAGESNKNNAPITFGQVFKKGKYPADSTLVALINDEQILTQSDIKATHSDGSVRHAIITLQIPQVTNIDQEIAFSLLENNAATTNNKVTVADVISSDFDTQLDIELYEVMINEIVFGDRSTSWFQGDLITLTFNGNTYQYQISKDGASNGENLGTSYQYGYKAATAFNDLILAEHSNVDIYIKYDRMYIKGTQAAKSYSLETSNTGSAPIAQNLLTTESDAVIYNINAKDALQNLSGNNTVKAWLEGNIASEWVVSAPLIHPQTQQKHPQLIAKLHIRAHKGLQQIKTDIVVENTWAYEEQVSNQYYDISVISNGQEVFSDSLEHFSHSRWKKTVWWGDAPDYGIKHDMGYMIATKAVPNYDISIEASESALQYYADKFSTSDYELMHVGSATKYMPQTGAHEDIGPIPRWQALYILSNDKRAKQASILNSDLAGTWSIHYRDKDTSLPVTIDDYPYMTINGGFGDTKNPDTGLYESFPECSGYCRNPYAHDTSHQPSFSYFPYLTTGDYYHMEEMVFWANYNLFSSNPGYRQYEKGLFNRDQLRGQGWSTRTLGQAAYLTPDDYPLKEYLIDKVNTNLDYYNTKYTNNNDSNKLGIITDGYTLGYNNNRGLAPWQQDYFTWSIGYLNELDFSNAQPLLEWLSKFQTGRMIDPEYCWISGATYSLNVRDNSQSDIYQTIGTAYRETIDPSIASLECASQSMADAFGLSQAGEMTGYATSATGYPASYQPALSVVTDLDTTQSRSAWNVFSNRKGKPDYSSEPQFAIVPRIVFDPENDSGEDANQGSDTNNNQGDNNDQSEEDETDNNDNQDNNSNDNQNDEEPIQSLSSVTAGTWYEIPSSNLSAVLPPETPLNWSGPDSIMSAWSGGTFDTQTGKLIIWGGGHTDYAGNEIYTFDTNTLQWERPWGPTPNTQIQDDAAYGIEEYLDGNPSSRHTYAGLVYLPEPYNSLWSQGGSRWKNGWGTDATWQYSFSENEWQKFADAPDSGLGVVAVYDPISKHVFSRSLNYINEYNPATDQWSQPYNEGWGWYTDDSNAAIAPDRRVIVFVGGEQTDHVTTYGIYDIDSNEYFDPGFSGDTEILEGNAPGIAYHPSSDTMIAWDGGTNLYQLNLDTWEWTKIIATNSSQVTPGAESSRGTFGRFQYVPEHDVFIVVNSIGSNVFAFKLPEE